VPPSRTRGHIAWDRVCDAIKQRNPTWSEQEVYNAALASDQGLAAFAAHSTEMRARTRGQ
jgi:hypothetical protein